MASADKARSLARAASTALPRAESGPGAAREVDACARTAGCALEEGHGGCCDPRGEAGRFAALFDLLCADVPFGELSDRLERQAREALERPRAPR